MGGFLGRALFEHDESVSQCVGFGVEFGKQVTYVKEDIMTTAGPLFTFDKKHLIGLFLCASKPLKSI